MCGNHGGDSRVRARECRRCVKLLGGELPRSAVKQESLPNSGGPRRILQVTVCNRIGDSGWFRRYCAVEKDHNSHMDNQKLSLVRQFPFTISMNKHQRGWHIRTRSADCPSQARIHDVSAPVASVEWIE